MNARERIISSYVRLIKSGKITIDDVPEKHVELVKELLEQ